MDRGIKIAVLMICLNEERYLDLCLTRIVDYADSILIAEGATELAVELGWAGPEGTSSDRTVEILRSWEQSSAKIGVIEGDGPWKDKPAMYNRLLGELPADITHVHLISPDEIYERVELKIIRGMLEADPDQVLAFQCCHYGPGGCELSGGENGVLDHFYHRVFPVRRGDTFPERSIDRLGSGRKIRQVRGIRIQHYGHINLDYSRKKWAYYKVRKERWAAAHN